MVSLRRRRLLGLSSGTGQGSSFGPLPANSESGNGAPNKSPVSTPTYLNDFNMEQKESAVSKERPQSSNSYAYDSTGSSKGMTGEEYPVKRRKRHPRKHYGNQEPGLMKGVYFKNMKWQAAIKVDKKQIHLGTVGSQEEAAHLYDRAAFMFGRAPNFELPEEEKQELRKVNWEEFLAMTRTMIASKKYKRRAKGDLLLKSSEPSLNNSDQESNNVVSPYAASEEGNNGVSPAAAAAEIEEVRSKNSVFPAATTAEIEEARDKNGVSPAAATAEIEGGGQNVVSPAAAAAEIEEEAGGKNVVSPAAAEIEEEAGGKNVVSPAAAEIEEETGGKNGVSPATAVAEIEEAAGGKNGVSPAVAADAEMEEAAEGGENGVSPAVAADAEVEEAAQGGKNGVSPAVAADAEMEEAAEGGKSGVSPDAEAEIEEAAEGGKSGVSPAAAAEIEGEGKNGVSPAAALLQKKKKKQ